jgi:hypothetical protein
MMTKTFAACLSPRGLKDNVDRLCTFLQHCKVSPVLREWGLHVYTDDSVESADVECLTTHGAVVTRIEETLCSHALLKYLSFHHLYESHKCIVVIQPTLQYTLTLETLLSSWVSDESSEVLRVIDTDDLRDPARKRTGMLGGLLWGVKGRALEELGSERMLHLLERRCLESEDTEAAFVSSIIFPQLSRKYRFLTMQVSRMTLPPQRLPGPWAVLNERTYQRRLCCTSELK